MAKGLNVWQHICRRGYIWRLDHIDVEVSSVKVRLGRKSKDAWSLVRLLLVLFLGLATVGAVQVRICRSLHPSRGLLECLRPSP